MAKFLEVTSAQAQKTLARKFIGLADSLRNLLTKFGLRTYKVTVVRIQWSGGRRGRGTPTVLSEDVISPTPKVEALDALTEIVQPIGIDLLGSITLSQISGRYTQEQLRGFGEDGTDIPLDIEFFYEIEFFPHDGPSFKQRFYPKSMPTYAPGKLGWSLRLEMAKPDRSRTGDP